MKSNLWFRRKTYGWGWTPITWQGWAVTALFVAIPLFIKLITKSLDLTKNEQNFYVFATLPLVLVGLVLVCLRYGEKPRWQWGIKTTKLSHIELFVSNYRESIIFYDLILLSLGWDRMVTRSEHTSYSDGTLKIIICPVEENYLNEGYHRKRVGLNHIALYAQTKDMVDRFHRDVLVANNIPALYDDGPKGDNNYYSVYFEDPDRIKLEVVYAPNYCEKGHWPNTLENTYDPYQS
ncbi:MAG: VOC family protein [Bacteriovorax sp.]|jgi:catechol 2,3-dioxygenase-like lactoylglutathione lyase family enzyme